MLIGESSKLHTDKHLWLRQQLELTPLDRLAMVYQANEEGNFDKVLKLYDKFLTIISSPGNRATLNKFDYESRYKNEMFKELKDNSDSFITELTRFIFARRGQWSDRFFEYLVF